jgi:hypothetical protein
MVGETPVNGATGSVASPHSPGRALHIQDSDSDDR